VGYADWCRGVHYLPTYLHLHVKTDQSGCFVLVRALYIQSDLRKDTENWFSALQKALYVSVLSCSTAFIAVKLSALLLLYIQPSIALW